MYLSLLTTTTNPPETGDGLLVPRRRRGGFCASALLLTLSKSYPKAVLPPVVVPSVPSRVLQVVSPATVNPVTFSHMVAGCARHDAKSSTPTHETDRVVESRAVLPSVRCCLSHECEL